MLLILKDGNTNGSLQLCHFLYILHMVYGSDHMCTSMGLYAIMICTYSVTVDMYLCALFAASGLGYY